MTGRAVFFNRTGAKSLVTPGTLLVEGITAFGDFFITLIRIMAFNTGLGLIIFVLGKGVMAVAT
jgi:hypothetical protein